MSNDFPLDASKYKFLHLIGCGSTSEVRTAICLTNHRELAIKLINLEAYPMEIDLLRQEVAFWSSSQHPTVVKYYNSFTSGTTLYILMEVMSGGSVADILRYAFPNGFKDECIIATILNAILRALDYIHSNKELHRDVKPANALAGSDGQIKIGDFGVAASLLINPSRFTVIGTPCYMAPEVLESTDGYTEKADIWSFGITAIELAMGSAPYASMAPLQIIQKVLKAPPPTIPANSGFSPEFRQLVKSCLNYDPNKRPTAHELLKHPFFDKVKGPEYIRDNVLVKLPPLEQRFPMFRQEMANQIMNNVQQQPKPAKTEWNFDVSENDSPKKAENPSSNSPNIPDLSKEQHPSNSTTTPSNPIATSSNPSATPSNPSAAPPNLLAKPLNPTATPSNLPVPSNSPTSSKSPIQRSSTCPSKSITTSASYDVDKINITNISNVSDNTKNATNNEHEEVHYKGRFTFKVKRQPSPSLSTDKVDKTSSSDYVVPQINSSPLFDSPRPLLNSSSFIVPQETANTDLSDEEEARLQEMVDQLTVKVDGLIEEGKEIKQDIMKLLKTVQVLTSSQNKH